MTERKQPCIEALRLSRPDVAITVKRTRGGPSRQRSGGAIHFPCRPQPPPANARVSEARPTTEPLPPRPACCPPGVCRERIHYERF